MEIELKLSAFYILEYLCAMPVEWLACLSVSDIARRIHLHRHTVSVQLKWLDLCGLIQIIRTDRCLFFEVAITAEGRAALEKHRDELRQISKL